MTLTGRRLPPTILVAEDNEAVRRLVCTVLTEAGYHVVAATDGVEALGIAESHAGEFAMLLTDVKMPRLGGLELARRLGAKWPGIPGALMSATPTDGTLSDPGGPFIQKPFQPAELVNIVREMLHQ